MAGVNTAAQFNSDSMVQMLEALGTVTNSIEANTQTLLSVCAYFGQDNCPIEGKDAEDIKEAYAQMKEAAETALSEATSIKNALTKWAEAMNISMDFANKTAAESAAALKEAAEKAKNARNAQ